MSVDHQSSIRTQTKDAQELDEAAAMIARLTAERDAAFTAGARAGIAVAAKLDENRNWTSGVKSHEIRAIDPTTLTEARDADNPE